MEPGSSARPRLLGRWSLERVCLVVLLVGSLGFYLVNAVHYEGMPLRIEENEWPRMGRGTYEHGIPLLHPNEDPRVYFNDNLERIEYDASGLWHPPTYMYAMAATMAVVGTDATASLRWIGVAGLLVCCVLIFLLGRELFPRHWFRVGAIASSLLLVHPYAIQGSLFLDIDTSIYAPTFLLFALLLAKYDKRGIELWPTAAMAASFALILWVKLPTAFVVVPVVTLYWVLRHGLIAGLERSVAVLLGGAFVFLGTYWLYTDLSGQSFSYMFNFTLVQKSNRLFWNSPWPPIENSLAWHLSWFTPALVLIAVAYGGLAARRWWRTRLVEPLDFIWGLGLAIFLAYAFVSPNGSVYQGKYAFPAIPLMVFAATAFLLAATRERPGRRSVAVAVLAAVAAAAVMPDLLTNQAFWLMSDKLRVAVVLGSAAALWIAVRGVGRARILPAAALIVCFGLFVAQARDSYHAGTSPLYPVPDTLEFRGATALINASLAPGQTALVSKDLGLYVDGPVLEGQTLSYLGGDPAEAKLLRENPDITVVGSDSFFSAVMGPESAQVLETCFDQHVIGVYTSVYTRKSANCPAPQ